MKKSFFFVGCVMVASLLMVSCQNGNEPNGTDKGVKLWPAFNPNNKKWGYMDVNGEWKISAQFNDARDFSGGYALVKSGAATEFIGTDGEHVNGVPSIDACSGEFHYGYMRFRSGGYWGMMDNNLRVKIDPYRAELGEMSDVGLICCKKNPDDKYGYIDITGKEIIEPLFDEAMDFVDGVAVVKRQGQQYSAISKAGKKVIEANYPSLVSLGNGRLAYYSTSHKRYGLLDTQGKEVGSPRFKAIYPFTDNGLARFRGEDDKFGFIDKDAKEVSIVNGNAIEATDFHEGVAFVRYTSNGKFVALGTNGTTKFELNQGEVPYGNFRNGLCLVWSINNQGNNAYRYINDKGETKREWSSENGLGNPAYEPICNPTYIPDVDPDFEIDTDPNQKVYYIKHPWGTGLDEDWKWKQMIRLNNGTYVYYGNWGGIGANINSIISDDENDPDYRWFPASSILGANSLEMETPVQFTYNPASNSLSVASAYEGTKYCWKLSYSSGGTHYEGYIWGTEIMMRYEELYMQEEPDVSNITYSRTTIASEGSCEELNL